MTGMKDFSEIKSKEHQSMSENDEEVNLYDFDDEKSNCGEIREDIEDRNESGSDINLHFDDNSNLSGDETYSQNKPISQKESDKVDELDLYEYCILQNKETDKVILIFM